MMAVNRKIEESLARLTFEHREEQFRHHTYDEDLYQYELLRRGDLKAREIGKQMFEGKTTGSLSDDPLTNYRYLFVASITLACRFCIEGGMSAEDAFNISDLYIRQMDRYRSVREVFDLHDTMFRDYLTRMQAILRHEVYSRQVHLCMDYIERNLQQPLTVEILAAELKLAPTYLSALFKKETGTAVSEYIRRKRIDTAMTLLQYTEYSCLEIAEYLCFASDSHFSRVFREYTGVTPTSYRKTHFRTHWNESRE